MILNSFILIVSLFSFNLDTNEKLIGCWICKNKITEANQTIGGETPRCDLKLLFYKDGEALYEKPEANVSYKVKYDFVTSKKLKIGNKLFEIKNLSDSSLTLVEDPSSILAAPLIEYQFIKCND